MSEQPTTEQLLSDVQAINARVADLQRSLVELQLKLADHQERLRQALTPKDHE